MLEKYFVHLKERDKIGIVYKEEWRQVTIGGKARYRNEIEELIEVFFDKRIPEALWTQKNKIKYMIRPFCRRNFIKVLEKISDDGYYVEPTMTIGRVMY